MDKDATTNEETLDQPAAADTAADADGKRGRILQTFQVRVTLRANEDGSEGTVPTNERLADVVEQAIYEHIEDFERDAIRARAEQV